MPGAAGKLRSDVAPGRAVLLYEYNPQGEVSREGLKWESTSPTATLSETTRERISDHETKVIQVGGVWYLEKSTYGYPAQNSASRILLGRTRERLTNFGNAASLYNGSGNLVAEVFHYDTANQTVETYTYYSNGQLKSKVNADNRPQYFLYNSRGQLTHQWGIGGDPVRYFYNDYGERYKMHRFQGGTWWQASLPTNFANLTPAITKWVFHEATGLLTEKRDPGYATDSTRKTTYAYIANTHQLDKVTQARGVQTTYGYQSSTGEVTAKTYSDSTPNVSFVYNRFGALQSVTDVTGVRNFHYRPEDLQISRVQLSSFYGSEHLHVGYDPNRRVRNEIKFGTETGTGSYRHYQAKWHYSAGRLASIEAYQRASTASRTFAYDYAPQSNLLAGYSTTLSGKTYRFERTYRQHENRIESVANTWDNVSRASFDYLYDPMGRIQSVTGTGNLYDGFGQQNSLKTSYYYNGGGRLEYAGGVVKNGSGGDVVMDSRRFDYRYDNAGNRTWASNGKPGQTNLPYRRTYTPTVTDGYSQIVDPDRDLMSGEVTSGEAAIWDHERNQYVPLNEAPRPGGGAVFEHDFAVGTGNNTSGPYDRWFYFSNPDVGWQSWVYPKKTQTPVYDKDGNLLWSDQFAYTYDAENRLIEVINFSDRMRMKYDYRSRRVEQEYARLINDTWTVQWTKRFLYDGWNVIAEIDATKVPSAHDYVTRAFFWGPDITGTMNGAGGIGGLLLIDHRTGGLSTRYLPTYDARGNVVGLVSESSGALVAKFEYSPYGKIIRMTGAYAQTPFRYQTKWDMDFGSEATSFYSWNLMDYGLRWYDAKHGRFVCRDPIEESGGLNLYEAFNGDPINRFDLLGMHGMAAESGGFFACGFYQWHEQQMRNQRANHQYSLAVLASLGQRANSSNTTPPPITTTGGKMDYPGVTPASTTYTSTLTGETYVSTSGGTGRYSLPPPDFSRGVNYSPWGYFERDVSGGGGGVGNDVTESARHLPFFLEVGEINYDLTLQVSAFVSVQTQLNLGIGNLNATSEAKLGIDNANVPLKGSIPGFTLGSKSSDPRLVIVGTLMGTIEVRNFDGVLGLSSFMASKIGILDAYSLSNSSVSVGLTSLKGGGSFTTTTRAFRLEINRPGPSGIVNPNQAIRNVVFDIQTALEQYMVEAVLNLSIYPSDSELNLRIELTIPDPIPGT